MSPRKEHTKMSEENIKRMSLEEAILHESEDRTDWGRLRREQANGVEPEKDPGEAEFDWSKARVVIPSGKTQISVRLDNDVLAFFKAQGRGYQTRINAVLRIYMEAQQNAASRRE